MGIEMFSKDDLVTIRRTGEEGVVKGFYNGLVVVSVNNKVKEFKPKEIELKDMNLI